MRFFKSWGFGQICCQLLDAPCAWITVLTVSVNVDGRWDSLARGPAPQKDGVCDAGADQTAAKDISAVYPTTEKYDREFEGQSLVPYGVRLSITTTSQQLHPILFNPVPHLQRQTKSFSLLVESVL
jgi:hypothetical protein